MKPALTALGTSILLLGFLALRPAAWIGWPEILLGALALVAAAPAQSQHQPYAGIVLGVATLCIWMLALAVGVVAWVTWLTFALGVAFVLSSPAVTQPPLPPGPPDSGSNIPP